MRYLYFENKDFEDFAGGKEQKITNLQFKRIKKIQVGKRKIEFLQLQ